MPGILSRLGSFGRRIVQTAIAAGRSIAETLRFVRPVAPDVTVEATTWEWGQVSQSEEAEPLVLAIPDSEYVPDRLHSVAPIPWRRKYCYTVTVYGRDLVGQQASGKGKGQFAHYDYNMTVSQKMTIGEIKATAATRIGRVGDSPIMDIFRISVSNAWEREE